MPIIFFLTLNSMEALKFDYSQNSSSQTSPSSHQSENIIITFRENMNLTAVIISEGNLNTLSRIKIDSNIMSFSTFAEDDVHIIYTKPFQNPPKLIYHALFQNISEEIQLPSSLTPVSTAITKNRGIYAGVLGSSGANTKIIVYKKQMQNWTQLAELNLTPLSIPIGEFEITADSSENIHLFYSLLEIFSNSSIYHTIIYQNLSSITSLVDRGDVYASVSGLGFELDTNETPIALYRRGGNPFVSGVIHLSEYPFSITNSVLFGLDGDFKILENFNNRYFALIIDFGRVYLAASNDKIQWHLTNVAYTALSKAAAIISAPSQNQKIHFAFEQNNTLKFGEYDDNSQTSSINSIYISPQGSAITRIKIDKI